MTDAPQQFEHLHQWLSYIGQTHSAEIEMGLARVSAVADQLGVRQPAPISVIVAGTNGKGSTTVALEALLLQAGVRVGATLSPHISTFNERVRLGGDMASDQALCDAFAAVDAARQDIPLTYFEFATLAALWLFAQRSVEVALLEVGLGGRLDAFNLVDAQVAVITSIGLDHQTFLGDDVNTIGREKAGVLRPRQTAIFGPRLPLSIAAVAAELGTKTLTLGSDCHLSNGSVQPGAAQGLRPWRFESAGGQTIDVAGSRLAPANCALALQAAEVVLDQLGPQAIGETSRSPLQATADKGGGTPDCGQHSILARTASVALGRARLNGRFQRLVRRGRQWILDVGHNPLAAAWLLQQLRDQCPSQRVVALFGQLADKDSAAVVACLQHRIATWVLVPTAGPRRQTAMDLMDKLAASSGRSVDAGSRQNPIAVPLSNFHCATTFEQGIGQALAHCGPRDVILAFGAFNVVEEVLLRLPSDS